MLYMLKSLDVKIGKTSFLKKIRIKQVSLFYPLVIWDAYYNLVNLRCCARIFELCSIVLHYFGHFFQDVGNLRHACVYTLCNSCCGFNVIRIVCAQIGGSASSNRCNNIGRSICKTIGLLYAWVGFVDMNIDLHGMQ